MNELKKGILKAVVSHLKETEFLEIKSKLDGFDTPSKIVWKSSQNGYVPDITAVKNNVFILFDILESPDFMDDKKTSWQLISTYTNNREREFFIVSPKNKEFTVRNFIDEHLIKAKILPVSLN